MNDHRVDHIIRLERLRRENVDEWMEITSSCRNPHRRGILAAVALENEPTTYANIEKYVSCTRRTVRKHTYELRDEGVLEITDSNPAILSYQSEAIEILAKDVVSTLVSDK